jgi:hypothetical protein
MILVRVVHSIQNSSCIKYSTQNQHFAEMITYSDNTNYNLNFYYFIVSIYFFNKLRIFKRPYLENYLENNKSRVCKCVQIYLLFSSVCARS